jgi:aromatic-L-amino-acid/L-tryptophan decarboxylase
MPHVTSAEDGSEELSLDPDDWESFRVCAHAALDDAIEFVRTARQRPVWQPVPERVRNALSTSAPQSGQNFEEVYQQFKDLILPYSTGNTHPRFFGWVHGTGLAGGIVAEMLAAAMNANCGGRDHGAIYVEHAVLDWFKELFGMPDSARGVLVSGTSMANLIAMTIARSSRAGEMRSAGVSAHPRRLVAYASEEVHDCVVKAMEVLGLGAAYLRKIPTDALFRMDLQTLRERLAEDCLSGLEPFCVIGTAGAVNTGAIDDLDGLAELCANHKIWFHVDGAFGGLGMLSDVLRPRLRGIERADSVAFDLHKWMHVPYDAGCVLVRHGDLHQSAFSMRPPYLGKLPRGLAGGAYWPCDFGIELSRGFRALKVWFAIKEHGTRRFGRLMEQNCAQARYLAERIGNQPELELLAPVSLNIVCFRYRVPGIDDEALDELNADVVQDLHESGVAAPSTTRVRSRLAIRVNITNHRSRRADFEILLAAVLAAGRRRAQARVYTKSS